MLKTFKKKLQIKFYIKWNLLDYVRVYTLISPNDKFHKKPVFINSAFD